MNPRHKLSYYELLDIAPDARREDIALAYQRALEALARDADADPNARATLRIAYDTLTDPTRRMSYDLSLRHHEPLIVFETVDEEGTLVSRIWGSIWGKSFVVALVLIAITLWLRPGKQSGDTISRASDPSLNTASTVIAKTDSGDRSNAAAPQRPTAKSDSTASTATGRSAEDVFALVSASVVRINVSNAEGQTTSSGSGVVIASGTVITNCHVALRGESLEVKVSGASYSASVEVADEERDLCRLGVSGLNAPAVSIGSVESVRVGQRVFAIGAPQGLDLTISDGIVSALREMQGGRMIQTTAPVSPGSSGGGLFDTSGKLVGIVTFQTRTGQNLNFAVPADWVSEIKNR